MGLSFSTRLVALAISLGTLFFSYVSLGAIVAMVFASGYLGGFLLWICFSAQQPTFDVIRKPFWATWAAFIFLHKIEENRFKFFEVVSQITGVSVPEIGSLPLTMLLLLGVVPWLLIPYFFKRNHPLGTYFAWTFFASMGITELAHFVVFPFFVDGPYGYFPGMGSVVVLAPVAWWGMWKLSRNSGHVPV